MKLPPQRLGKVPLERALSKLGVASRTVARGLILAGKVTVGGEVVRDPLFALTPEKERLTVDGVRVGAQAWRTILLHKPRGVVTTRSDEKGRRTVFDLLGPAPGHLAPVGRLDFATSGLLLLTNDTQLANWLTDPASSVTRIYLVSVRGEVSDGTAAKLTAGVQDEGELLQAQAVEVRKRSRRESHLVVQLTEGKNREIRRMLDGAGHEVLKLKRVSYGPLELGELAPGAFREVSREEIAKAFPGAPLRP